MNEDLIIADTIEGIPHPGECRELVGHEGNVRRFLERYASGKLHHAHLVVGKKGIGKATFALRMASHLFKHPDPSSAPLELVPSGEHDPVDGKLGAGAHPNLLHLTRPWDEKTKKFKTQLTVDEIRRTVSFFGTSKGESGWRVAIVDATDDMNQNAANALLKVLEEPPERTVFFVISHATSRVLPTIRSRCQELVMKPLEPDEVLRVLDRFEVTSGLPENDRNLLGELSGGSVRAGIILAQKDGLDLYRKFTSLTQALDKPDWTAVQSLADKVSLRGKDDQYRLLIRFAEEFMEQQATCVDTGIRPISVLARWAEVWEKTRNSIRIADAYNLDRKQTILNLFQDMGQAARG